MSDLDRLKKAFQRLLSPLQARLDYAKRYAATVVAQNADGSLELRSGTPRLPSLSKVPIRYGVPGVTVSVASGGEVLVGFENADPSLPYALVYDQASVISIALLGGTKAIARIGDGCQLLLPPATFVGTVTTGSGESPLTGPATMANLFSGVIESGLLGALS